MHYYQYYYVPVDGLTDLNNESEFKDLWEPLVSNRFEFYIEVGVGHLGTLCSLAKIVKERNIRCHCIGIDIFGEMPKDIQGNNSHQGDVISLQEAQEYLRNQQLDAIVTLYKGDSSVVLRQVLHSIQHQHKLVFIDANHTYDGCRADFEAADGYLIEGDWLVFHDCLRHQHPDYGRGPRGVIEDLLLHNNRYRMLKLPPAHVDGSEEARTNTLGIFQCLVRRLKKTVILPLLPPV